MREVNAMMDSTLKSGNRCTAQLPNGQFCNGDAVPTAPYPICAKHARMFYKWARQYVEDRLSTATPLPFRPVLPAPVGILPSANAAGVYYLRAPNDLVKIGCTARLGRRLTEYRNVELLALEAGSFDLEASRLLHFTRHLVSGREWFTPADELISHVNAIRDQVGQSPIVGTAAA